MIPGMKRLSLAVPLILICVLFLTAGVLMINDLNIYTPDSARYLIWAKSLARFDGYIDRTLPEPERYVIHAPLYPVLLAPAVLVFGGSILTAKVFTLLVGLIAIIALHFWLRQKVGARYALVGAVLLAGNALFFLFSSEVLSDVPFALCIIAFFILLERFDSPRGVGTGSFLAFLGVLTAGILLREVGFALVFAAAGYFFLKKDYKQILWVVLLPLAVYASWWVRNEFIVAGFEHPTFTNTILYTKHYFSAPGDPILKEYLARIAVNAGVYWEKILSLIFFPTYLSTSSILVNGLEEPFRSLNQILTVLKYPLWILSGGLVILGIYHDVTKSLTGKVRLVFLCFYVLIILLYPINDIRFLLPALIIFIFSMVNGCAKIFPGMEHGAAARIALWGTAVLLMVPNIAWIAQVSVHSFSYEHSAQGAREGPKGLENEPWHFTKYFRSAGAWIEEHAASADIVFSQWKEMSSWISPRKLIVYGLDLPVGEFDALMRDYGVKYLVAVTSTDGSREFDFQMMESLKFSFLPLAAFGNVEIFQVAPGAAQTPGVTRERSAFQAGVAVLEEGHYAEAGRIFGELERAYPNNVLNKFYLGVARSFAGDYGVSDSIFTDFRAYSQAGVYLFPAVRHQRLMKVRQEAASSPDAGGLLASAASEYWNMGFHSFARSLLNEAFVRDSLNALAAVYGIYFSLSSGTISDAQNFLARLERSGNEPAQTAKFAELVSQFDSLGTDRAEARRRHLESAARLCVDLRMYEGAISNLLAALGEDPNNTGIMLTLAGLYEAKSRYAPALRLLEEALRLDPGNSRAAAARRDLRRRLYMDPGGA